MKNYLLPGIILLLLFFSSCQKSDETVLIDPSLNLRIDSIVASKKTLEIWEQANITVYAKGEGITYKWETNHGSMAGIDSSTVIYWGCPTCVGLNTVECQATNEFGTVSDTIMVIVKPN